MNTVVIGPQVWRLLDTWALAASQNPQLHGRFAKIILSLRYVFPCRACREALGRYFSREEVVKTLYSEDPITFVYDLHADVNRRTGRGATNELITPEIHATRLRTISCLTTGDDVWDWFFYIFVNLAQRQPQDIDFEQVLEHMRQVIQYAKLIGQIPASRKFRPPVNPTPREYLRCICDQYKTRPDVESRLGSLRAAIADKIIFSEASRLDRPLVSPNGQ